RGDRIFIDSSENNTTPLRPTIQIQYEKSTTPTANNDSYRIAPGQTLSVAGPGVLANDSDPDGDKLSAILVSGPANGALTLSADGSFTYVPNPGFTGTDSFTYKANDGTTDSNVATVKIITNHAPTAKDDFYIVTENNTLNAGAPGVLGNDSDPEGDPLTAGLVSGPSHGSLTLNSDGSFVYPPASNFLGSDSFT